MWQFLWIVADCWTNLVKNVPGIFGLFHVQRAKRHPWGPFGVVVVVRLVLVLERGVTHRKSTRHCRGCVSNSEGIDQDRIKVTNKLGSDLTIRWFVLHELVIFFGRFGDSTAVPN